MKRAHILALLVATALVTAASRTEAGDYGLHGGLPWFGYGYSGSLYGLGRIPVPPYYALHPPVYYSHPVPRPYGHSPFAWRSHQSQLMAPQPKLTINPHFKPETEKATENHSRTARITINKHYVSAKQELASQSH